MIRELREELDRVRLELQTTMTGGKLNSAASLLLMRGQIKENEAILKELETPWEEKIKLSEACNRAHRSPYSQHCSSRLPRRRRTLTSSKWRWSRL